DPHRVLQPEADVVQPRPRTVHKGSIVDARLAVQPGCPYIPVPGRRILRTSEAEAAGIVIVCLLDVGYGDVEVFDALHFAADLEIEALPPPFRSVRIHVIFSL